MYYYYSDVLCITEAGKLAFKSLEENVRLDTLPCSTELVSDDEMGPTAAKRTKLSKSPSPIRKSSFDQDGDSSDVIIGSSLSDCVIDLPSSTSNVDEDAVTTLNQSLVNG